ncbi:MAG: 16S rRNA (cytidine(1402)-2'-O)-methyltransferase [Kiloniellales bacterium]
MGSPSAEPSGHRSASKPPAEESGRHGGDAAALPGGLYLVATPIGNAADITLRALDVLGRAEAIACEDRRVTGKLLRLHGIERHGPLIAYHEHNAERVRPGLIERLRRGQSVALVSDAGTPVLSDPGFRLVRAAIDAGLPMTAVPGPAAPVAALILSGLPVDRVLFAGFLPARRAARRKALAELAPVPASLVFLESPRRLAAALADMAERLGPRPATVARELTKLFEEVRRDRLDRLAAAYAEAGPPKGEVVVVVGPPPEVGPDQAALDRLLAAALDRMSLRDAAAEVAATTGVARRRVYARALALTAARR